MLLVVAETQSAAYSVAANFRYFAIFYLAWLLLRFTSSSQVSP